jgi:hypothetical protein
MNGRQIAALGICVVAVTAGIATWILGRYEPPFVPPPPPPKLSVDPPRSVDPPSEAPAPVVARRTKKAPELYLPPYVKPPHLLTEPVLPVYAEETRNGRSFRSRRSEGRP